MMRSALRTSLQTRLLAAFIVLFVVLGTGTLFAIEHTLANDLLSALDARLTKQGNAVASWLAIAGHPDRLAPRLAAVTGARLTIIGADGLVQGDSADKDTAGRPVGEAWEVSRARHGVVGRAVRKLRPDEPEQYLVAVPAEFGRVIRLSVPLEDVIETRARMRNRLLVGFGFGFLGALFLSWIFARALTRPLQSMTRTAERLAAGDYEVTTPAEAMEAGGELGVLARAMMRMVGEVKGRVEELTEQRDLLSVVFAGLVEGVLVVGRDGSVALANDAAKPMVGEGALPASLAQLVEKARYSGQSEVEVELSGRTVRASARPLGPAAHAGTILVLYDVTRMRALEAVRREFLSNAAHELRTPVTSISGYAETLLGGGVDPDTSREFLTTIHRNAQRIAHLVSDLLVLDQLGGRAAAVGERVRVELAEVVEHAARTTLGVAPTARIEVSVPAGLVVLATREGLDHVVQNLIDNAVKYGGGTPVEVRAELVGRRVRLSIRDFGPGIPPGHEDRIFERFYRLDAGRSRDQGGSGLGLAIVKSQVEALGGRVWVESASPGARFIVELDGEA